MGKQTAVAMTEIDEVVFLEFLRSVSEIKILQGSASTQKEIWIDHFSPRGKGCRQFYIWNTSFPWQPRFCHATQERSGKREEWYYVANTAEGPLIEYDRHDFADRTGQGDGRIYWAKIFAAPNGLPYDVEAFNEWFMRVVRWIRKNGKQRAKGTLNPYFLPDAWTKYGNRI